MNKPSLLSKASLRVLFLLINILSIWGLNLRAQVEANVDFLRAKADSVNTISVRWSLTDEKKWHAENDGRLEVMSLKANIRSSDLNRSASGVSYFQIDIPGNAMIELMVDLSKTVTGEQVFLWDNQEKKIIFEITNQSRSRFLTPAFNPATTQLVWKNDAGASFQSQFSIENIYYQDLGIRSVLDIGFGTAFACHPNAACKQDSMMKLISNSTVRIRLVMQEGIGWCSGAFVNTTRADKTPYLLTAYHCQFNYTPLYDMWRFDFQFKSDSCPNPTTEPQYFSLTGCALKASGQASDFLLVLLENPIPVNQPVTFAGWDHDEATIPDTSYLIHHPNADIRKFSTCVNPAVIHPNQIGWSEGYTTPANHHFHFKFTEGGHEPGSSGGPLFNEHYYLVGQLHGGTAGCENNNNAFAGRFAKSWNLGSTPEGRLKDWLDPDQTGLIRIPSLANISPDEIVNIHGIVLDPIGRTVKNAKLKITGSVTETLLTDESGTFEIHGVNRNGQYTITPEKTDNPSNGLNALDLLAIQKHLLVKDTFDFAWQHIAADATNNHEITVGDILVLLKLLLGKIQILPTSPSWRFDPPQVVLDSLPPGDPAEIQIMAIKIGDLNNTANPKE